MIGISTFTLRPYVVPIATFVSLLVIVFGWAAGEAWARMRLGSNAIVKMTAPERDGPLHGGLPPKFTAIPLTVCARDHSGEFCPYDTCSISIPQTSSPGALWNAYVISSPTGPLIICEWRQP